MRVVRGMKFLVLVLVASLLAGCYWNEQLLAEGAKTAIEVEIAQREGDKIAAQNAVYLENPYAYELALAGVYGDKTVFLPADANFNLWTSGVPVPTPGP